MSFLTGGGHRIKLNRSEYIRAGLALMLILLMIVLFALEVKYFSNTFQIKSLLKRALLFGGLVGLGLGYLWSKDNADMELLVKFQIGVAALFISVLVMPLLASLTNRHLSFGKTPEIAVELVKTEGFFSDRYGLLDGETPDGYHIFIIKDNQLERVKSKTNPFPDKNEGDKVLLPIRKGFWGYDWVDF